MQSALPRLSERIRAIEASEYRAAWHAEADAVQARGSKSAERLRHYEQIVAWVQSEFAEVDAIRLRSTPFMPAHRMPSPAACSTLN